MAEENNVEEQGENVEGVPAEGGTETPWNYAEGIAGTGVAPEWFKADKYATIADQAKGYKELEGRFGSFTGAPENYDLNLSEELTGKLSDIGYQLDGDDPLMEEAIKFARETNMNQDGFSKMMELYTMGKLSDYEAAEAFRNQELASLGVNAQERLTNIDAWGKANLPVELYEGLVGMATSAASVKTIEALIAKTRNAPVSATEASPIPGGITEDELRKMQFEKDDYGNRRLSTDPSFRKKFEKLSREFYGAHDHNIVVGI